MDAKSAILARARDAISRSQTRPVGPIPRNYIRSGENPPGSKPVVDDGLPQAYKKAAARNGRTVVEDSRKEAIATLDLNEIDAVVTCSRVGVSISGTIVLDGEPDQGRRAISLVPDKHVVVLERESIMPTVPQAVDVLGEHPTRPMTWIAGGSATSDIELVRVNGVHGPRNLRVVVAH